MKNRVAASFIFLTFALPTFGIDISEDQFAGAAHFVVKTTKATYYSQYCGQTGNWANACFIKKDNGGAIINRFFHIDETQVTGANLVTTANQVEATFYFSEDEYTALNVALSGGGSSALTNVNQLQL